MGIIPKLTKESIVRAADRIEKMSPEVKKQHSEALRGENPEVVDIIQGTFGAMARENPALILISDQIMEAIAAGFQTAYLIIETELLERAGEAITNATDIPA